MKKYIGSRSRHTRRSGDPGVPKVQKAELSEKNIPLRAIIAIAAFVIGIIALVHGFMKAVGTDSGWQEITVSSSADRSCADQFTLEYNLGVSGIAAGKEQSSIQEIYSNACVKAYEIFNSDLHFENVTNIYDLNHSPNTILTVDPVLYQALEQVVDSGSRLVYYGPLYETMDNLFGCETDADAESFDPVYDEDTAADFADTLKFANNSDAIELELLGENQVRLNVSDEYMAFAEEDGIGNYIDLYLMQNAFIIDYLADTLIENGYTLGTISSYDGYFRSLGDGEDGVSFTLYDRVKTTTGFDEKSETGITSESGEKSEAGGTSDNNGKSETGITSESGEKSEAGGTSDNNGTSSGIIVAAANVSAPSINAVVSLKDFPLQELDVYRFYEYESGEIRSPYLGSDGYCHVSVSNLVACSDDGSCAKILLSVLPYYISDTIDADNLHQLAARNDGKDIYTVYCQEQGIVSNIPDAVFTNLYDRDDMTYQVEGD